MTGGEVVAACGLFLLLPQIGRVNFKPLLLPFFILALYALGVIVTDLLYHHNYMELFMRGFAKPLFIGMIALFFYICFSLAPRSILFYLYALPVAILIYAIRPPKDDIEGSSTEYAQFVTQYGPIFIIWARFIGATLYAKSKLLASSVFFALAPFMALFGSRSDALLCFMVGGVFVSLAFLKDPKRPRIHLSKTKLAAFAMAGMILLSTFYAFYVYAAPRGILGEMQEKKFTAQTQTEYGASPIGLVLSGRTETVALLIAGIENPIFGLGSWPVLSDYYYKAVAYTGDAKAIKRLLEDGGGGRSSGHSAILGSWVTAGIFGLVFWLYLAFVVFKVLLRLIRDETLLTAWVIPGCIFFYWHWAFSPIGTGARQSAGIFIAMYAAFLAANSIPEVRMRFYRECRLAGSRSIASQGRRR
jgi:O-antigen ligase